jgi:SET domain-containing protein
VPDLPGFQRNSEIQVIEKDRVFLVANKNITAGEEIFTAYGFDYWDFFLSKVYETKYKHK